MNRAGTSQASMVVSDSLAGGGCGFESRGLSSYFEATFEPVLQIQLQAMNPIKTRAEIPLNAGSPCVPGFIVGHAIPPPLGVCLDLVSERLQDGQGSFNLLVRHIAF